MHRCKKSSNQVFWDHLSIKILYVSLVSKILITMLPHCSWVLQTKMYVRVRKSFVNRKLSKNPTILLQISSRKSQRFAKMLFESLKFKDRLITFYQSIYFGRKQRPLACFRLFINDDDDDNVDDIDLTQSNPVKNTQFSLLVIMW